MASKALPKPLIHYVAKRGYAMVMPAIKDTAITCNIQPSGTVVAALDNGSPVTRITVAFRAGSRYEPPTDIGISHMLRAAAGLSTGNASTFILARKFAQLGASFTASGDREFIYYTLETIPVCLDAAVENLCNLISNQEFRSWELSDITPRLKYDIASLSPQVRAVDLLHKAAYRRGLGNSLFCAPKRIGTFSSESLQHYAGVNVIPARCAITVVGDTEDKGMLLAQNLRLATTGCDSPDAPTSYYGGEIRKEMGGELTHVALALHGAPANSQDALALAIAAKALGNGPVIKWGYDNSVLAKAIGNIGPFAAAGFNVSYTDSGLFGVVLTVPKDEANSAVKSVGKLLKNPCLTPDNIRAGRNQLKVQLLSEAEIGTTIAESVAAQCLYTGSAKTPGELAAAITNIPDATVSAALSKAASSRLSMGAAGNLTFCPYLDEL